jgi:hypothetical protein
MMTRASCNDRDVGGADGRGACAAGAVPGRMRIAIKRTRARDAMVFMERLLNREF